MLLLVSGVFWTITYLLIIRRGFIDRTFGMPLVALAANLSWEFVYSVLIPHKAPQLYIDWIWLGLDCLILFQLLRFGQSEFNRLSTSLYYCMVGGAFFTAFFVIYSMGLEFGEDGDAYAAFGQNLMMSFMFITMGFGREDMRGQSVYIALAKGIGTACASLAFWLYSPISDGLLMPFLYISIAMVDLIYLGFLIWQAQKKGINPWHRV